MSKNNGFDWSDPRFEKLGIIPEDLLWELWPIKETYRSRWLSRERLPFKVIADRRWFSVDHIRRWFQAKLDAGDPMEEDQLDE